MPESWKVQVRASVDAPWTDVAANLHGVKDRYDGASFAPVVARFVRLAVKLRKDFSGGVLEWKLR